MQSHPLDGDGVNFEIFKYLCKLSRKATPCEIKFKIPETIVFANGCASVWYYYDEGTQTVCQRPARDLDRRNLFEVLSKKRKTDRCDIVAQFTAWTGDEGHLTSTYYTKPDLQAFLFGSSKGFHGLLQKFVEPREDRNDLIEVAWSPQMTFAVRRVNEHRIFDRNLPPAVRAATFDGASHVCEESFCNATVRKQMGKATESLVNHFREVDEEFEIARCVCFFKQDAFDDIWLLYTTSVRIIESSGDAKNTAAYDPEQMTRKPALVPLLLTMQALSESKVAKLRSGGREVVAPPPRRLRGDFFTPAAPVDEAVLERASARRRQKMDEKRAEQKAEQERLFGVLTKLRREVATLHATLDAGLPIARAKTASPSDLTSSTTSSPLSRAPARPAHGSGASNEYGSPRSAHSPTNVRRGTRSPRRRRSQIVGAGSSVSLRSVEVEADALVRSGRTFAASEQKRALYVAGLISDALYPLAQEVAGSRRPLLNRRTAAEAAAASIGPWSFSLPRALWRWMARNWGTFGELGINLACHEENRELDEAEALTGALGPRAQLRRLAMRQLVPSPSVTIHVLEPLPTAGALQRFAARIQAIVVAQGEFVAAQSVAAAMFIAKLPGQSLFDELRLLTQGRRESLDAVGYFYEGVRKPSASKVETPVATPQTPDAAAAALTQRSPALLAVPSQAKLERKRSVKLLSEEAEGDETGVAATPTEGSSSRETPHSQTMISEAQADAPAEATNDDALTEPVEEPSKTPKVPRRPTESFVDDTEVVDATDATQPPAAERCGAAALEGTDETSATGAGDSATSQRTQHNADAVVKEAVSPADEPPAAHSTSAVSEEQPPSATAVEATGAETDATTEQPIQPTVSAVATPVVEAESIPSEDAPTKAEDRPTRRQSAPSEVLQERELVSKPSTPEPVHVAPQSDDTVEAIVTAPAAAQVGDSTEATTTNAKEPEPLAAPVAATQPPVTSDAPVPPKAEANNAQRRTPTSLEASRDHPPRPTSAMRPSSAARKPSAKPGATSTTANGKEIEWPSSSSDSFHIDDDEPAPPARPPAAATASSATPAPPPPVATTGTSSSVKNGNVDETKGQVKPQPQKKADEAPAMVQPPPPAEPDADAVPSWLDF